jgi:hypothetical protein
MNERDERLEQPQLDDRLRQLAIAAQHHPQGSSARRRALTELISVMQLKMKPTVEKYPNFRVSER